MKINCVPNPELGHFLKRELHLVKAAYELDLNGIFCDILTRANDFLPSEAGSIFIDDPTDLEKGVPIGDLVMISCFGEAAERLVGIRVPANKGIVGYVYASGRSYYSDKPAEDPLFYGASINAARFRVRSLICCPLSVEGSVIGAIELLNRIGPRSYDDRDLKLLEIFAQTISVSIANAIDAYRSKEMTKRDELTGLYNDRYLLHSLREVLANCLTFKEECGLIFLDLDRFKSVNDVHGHLAGSRVLSEVGGMLQQILPGQSIAARYGGDEFVIVLPGAGRQELMWVAETVRKSIESFVFLEKSNPIDPTNYPALNIANLITCSVGVATLRGDITPVLTDHIDALTARNELLRLADACMYEAKEIGRNNIVCAWGRPPRQNE